MPYQTRESKMKLDQVMEYVNSEIVSCRSATRHVANQIESLAVEEASLRHQVSCIEQDVQADILRIENRLNETLPLPPSPLDLVKLCVSFEDKVRRFYLVLK